MTVFGRCAAGLAVALALCLGCEPRAEPEAPRPNLVLIVIDTLRSDRLSFYGHSANTAPFLASLAEQSLVFTNAHSTSSWTGPAMASLFLSLHPFQHGMHIASLGADRESFEVKVLPDSVPTLAESLREVGYETYAVTDNQNVSEEPGFSRGFDRFASTHYESAVVVSQTLDAWRDDILSSQPFFLYVHYMDPHLPYNAREPWYGENSAAGEEDDNADTLARYDSEIRYVDQFVEKLFDSFDWGDDTVVVVTSDHGEEFGDHGGYQHGRTLYREVVDIPLLLHSPARWPTARRIDERASLIDIAPTFLALARHPGAPTHVGRSLLPEDRAAAPERSVYTQLIWEDEGKGSRVRSESRGVIRGDFKFLDHDRAPDQLFDLGADQNEMQSVLAQHPEVAKRLAEDLSDAMESSPRFEPGTARIPLSPKQIEKLKALGYAK